MPGAFGEDNLVSTTQSNPSATQITINYPPGFVVPEPIDTGFVMPEPVFVTPPVPIVEEISGTLEEILPEIPGLEVPEAKPSMPPPSEIYQVLMKNIISPTKKVLSAANKAYDFEEEDFNAILKLKKYELIENINQNFLINKTIKIENIYIDIKNNSCK